MDNSTCYCGSHKIHSKFYWLDDNSDPNEELAQLAARKVNKKETRRM